MLKPVMFFLGTPWAARSILFVQHVSHRHGSSVLAHVGLGSGCDHYDGRLIGCLGMIAYLVGSILSESAVAARLRRN